MTTEWPDLIELTLDGMAQGGAAVSRWGGRVVFAQGGLPGERVQVQLHERRPAFAYGRVMRVLQASPERVEPRMPSAEHAPWQHIAYPAQLDFKRRILAEQLSKLAGLQVTVPQLLPSPQAWAYRNTARLHAANGKLGYHAAGTREVQDLPADLLLLPVLNEALAGLRRVWHGEPGLRNVLLRTGANGSYALGLLFGQNLPIELAEDWRSACLALAGVQILDGRGRRDAIGATRVVEELDGVFFELAPESFFQTNAYQSAALLNLVRAGLELPAGGSLIDAYSGVGAFALPLGRTLERVVAIEESPAAVADGRAAVRNNGIGSVSFVEGRVEAVLAGLEGPFDAILLDPPRRGCDPVALQEMLRLAPRRIVYVSCHPGTLARDLAVLTQEYSLLSVIPIDLFPQTPHIECVVVLEHR